MGYGTVTDYWFEPTVPTVYCQMHQSMTVCADTGMLATEYCPNTTVKGVVVIPNGHPLSDYVNDPQYGPVIAEYLGTASDYNYCTLHQDGYSVDDGNNGGYGYDGDLVSDAQQLLQTAYDFMSQLDASSTHYQNIQTAASNLEGLLAMGSASTADIANAMAQITQAMAGF